MVTTAERRPIPKQLWATIFETTRGFAAVAASAYGLVACNWRMASADEARRHLRPVLKPLVSSGGYACPDWLAESGGLPPHLAAARIAFHRFDCGDHNALASLDLDNRARSPFAASVLRTVQAIPAGAVLSYGRVAELSGSPRAARAVGQVMAHNPLAPVVPCHRVIAAGGQPGGFGPGLPAKIELLAEEGVSLESI